ncbi:von Hippel-Lindau disease tumor suppressor-like [Pecten maximus]|uniref:von Hippel-Lindau disease tumor suppressor-like n=1 Tax=Pecten maximus TaxID=6579 RepID=UPI001458E707|nr:von Hippel-Lindau disease tumor suppressor-like [Pecten maximus]
MAEFSEESEEKTQIIRSIHNDVTVNVKFSNRSGRTVSLLWYNFKGVFVKYAILHDKDSMDMFTYETHPWGARDATTGDVLNIGGDAVFYPQAPADGVESNIFPVTYIDLPLYSLKEICLQQVQKLFPKKKIKAIDDVLPRTLLTELKEGGKHEVHLLYKNIKVSKGSHAEHKLGKDGLVEVVKFDGQTIPMGNHQLETDSEEEKEETVARPEGHGDNLSSNQNDFPPFHSNKSSNSCCCS